MNAKPTSQLASELIELAIILGPEDEGIDIDDLDLEVEDLVNLKSRLSSMRKACDVVNAAVAQYWIDHYPVASFTDEHTRYWVGKSKGKAWAGDEAEQLFAGWLKEQDADKIAKIISISGIRVGQLPKAVRSTFLDETERVGRPGVRSKPL